MGREKETIVIQQQSQAIPALVSFFIPGLGHLIQGRLLGAIGWFTVLATLAIASVFTFGAGLLLFIPAYIYCIWDTTRWQPPIKKVRV